jgi:hypothetical protein
MSNPFKFLGPSEWCIKKQMWNVILVSALRSVWFWNTSDKCRIWGSHSGYSKELSRLGYLILYSYYMAVYPRRQNSSLGRCLLISSLLHKRLHLRAYKIQMIHALKPSDQIACTNFDVDMLERIDASPNFVRQVCFSDEATFQVNGVVNRYIQLQDLGQSKSTCHVWVGERQSQSGPA